MGRNKGSIVIEHDDIKRFRWLINNTILDAKDIVSYYLSTFDKKFCYQSIKDMKNKNKYGEIEGEIDISCPELTRYISLCYPDSFTKTKTDMQYTIMWKPSGNTKHHNADGDISCAMNNNYIKAKENGLV
jgi:hypothetical protein